LFDLIRRETPLAPRLRSASRRRDSLDDEARFLRSWIEKPLQTGALMPSGRFLARAMAAVVDPQAQGSVIELGPGTGPVTEALIRRGVAQEKLILVEYNTDFCTLLRKRFPLATVVQGDAYDLETTLGKLNVPASAIVSSLPLLNRPVAVRLKLFEQAIALMAQNAPFVQFTYGVVPPIPTQAAGAIAHGSQRIWLNLPPARVWTYRRPQSFMAQAVAAAA
jgi:phosphatidylethanolamine/phosphatidyl-N-methylethanolamine N-methyltransferase